MKTLFVSDLDGTLLSPAAELTAYAARTINAFADAGYAFTAATARTAATVSHILAGVRLAAPVILMNGVCSYDIALSRYTEVNYIPSDALGTLLEVIRGYGLAGFLYAVKNNSLSTYYERTDSPGADDFIEQRVRRYNKVFTRVASLGECTDAGCIYYSVSDRAEKLAAARKALEAVPGLHIEFYRDIYCADCWFMEVSSADASKRNALKALMSRGGFERAVGFGDNLNDLPLFECCDVKIAVANAHPDVIKAADKVIGSNSGDAVAHFLENIIKGVQTI